MEQFYYTIQPGEYLSLIAKKLYDKIDLWPAIYKLNQDKIGDNPDKVSAGMVLTLPRMLNDMLKDKNLVSKTPMPKQFSAEPKSDTAKEYKIALPESEYQKVMKKVGPSKATGFLLSMAAGAAIGAFIRSGSQKNSS